MNEDTDPFGPAHCKCCGIVLVDADDYDYDTQGQRSYALLRFDNGQTYRESADKDWSLCSLKCVIQFARTADESESARRPYTVFWSPMDGEFVATCTEIPGLSGLGASEQEAIAELKVAI